MTFEAVRLLLPAAIWLVACGAQANCFKVEELSGYSAKNWADYRFEADGISKALYIVIDGEDSFVSDSDLVCRPLVESLPSLVCMFMEGSKNTVETWSIDLEAGKAFYTKSTQGYGQFDGIMALVGTATRCD